MTLCTLFYLVGLLDDLKNLTPNIKLISLIISILLVTYLFPGINLELIKISFLKKTYFFNEYSFLFYNFIFFTIGKRNKYVRWYKSSSYFVLHLHI